jgi:hypothetical protein
VKPRPRSRRLRRALAGLTLTLTLAAGTALTGGSLLAPASGTAWGAPGTDDTAWGTPPTDQPDPGAGDDGSPTITPFDTAWG